MINDPAHRLLSTAERKLLSDSKDLAELLRESDLGDSLGKTIGGLCAIIEKIAPGGVILNSHDFTVDSVLHLMIHDGPTSDTARKILKLVGIEDYRQR